jgi:hypothetical protein
MVFEEPVEGGLTRFVAVYQCGDATKAGPVRSACPIDPVLVRPITRLEGDGGGDPGDLEALRRGHVVSITGTVSRSGEIMAGPAMRRVPRPGLPLEHTLYANTAALRKVGEKKYKRPPPDGIFHFSAQPPPGRRVHEITVNYENATIVTYRWRHGRWLRSEGTTPFMTDTGKQLGFQNVLVEKYTINLSKTDVDVLGHGAPIIPHPTGSGRAYLFRNGRIVVGKWRRSSLSQPVRFTSHSGSMALARGHTIIEVVPNGNGEIQGSVGYR